MGMSRISTVDHLIPAPKDGDPGAPAVGYFLVAQPSVIQVDADGSPLVNQVRVVAYKSVGGKITPYTGSATVLLYDAKGKLLFGGSSPMPGTIKPTADSVKQVARYDFRLIIDSQTVATLSIPVVANGTNGKDGTSFTVKGTANGHADSKAGVPSTAKGLWLVDDSSQGKPLLWYPESKTSSSVNVGDAYIVGSDIWVAGDKSWSNLGQFRGPQGAVGPQGYPGPMAYQAGEWQRGITYTRTSETVPVVSHNGCYWRPANEGSLLNVEPSADSDEWLLVSKDDLVFAKIIMSDFGKFGSAVMVGDYLISQYGRLNGETIDESSAKKDTAYTNFNPDNPEDSSKFVPRLYLNFRTGEVHCERGYFRGSVYADNGTFNGTVNAENGLFKGICRQPFVLFDGSTHFDSQGNSWSDAERYDNLALPVANDGWGHNVSFPWTSDCIGRKITLVNFQWRNLLSSDAYVISAPNGMYFYEDGSRKVELTINQEAVELLGYGDDKSFFGWIVLNRVPLSRNHGYGSVARILYSGKVTANRNTGTASLTMSYSYDGSSLTLQRVKLGEYKLKFPNFGSYISRCIPIVTGSLVGSTTDAKAVYASVVAQDINSFTVRIADDSSLNEGGFNFIVLPQ